MNTAKLEGIVIRRVSIGEADRILTIFTKERGKISVKASGVRKVPSRRAAHIELLNLVQVTLYTGKGMPHLTEAQTIESFSDVKADLLRMGAAYHFCELIDGLLPDHQEHRDVFELLKNALQELTTDKDISSQMYAFEMSLLHMLGFYPQSKNTSFNTSAFIEQILERRLRSKYLLPKLV